MTITQNIKTTDIFIYISKNMHFSLFIRYKKVSNILWKIIKQTTSHKRRKLKEAHARSNGPSLDLREKEKHWPKPLKIHFSLLPLFELD